MVLEKLRSEGLAALSYFIGSGTQAAVIDPRRDIEVYLDLAGEQGMPIAHIFETHRNEDFVVGSRDLAEATGAEFLLLDVRKRGEFEKGHLVGAQHIFVGELRERIDEVGDARPIVTFCGSGYRASSAASILLRNGFDQVENLLGSMRACMETACPLE